MKKGFMLLFVVLTLCIASATSAKAYTTPDFSDVPSSHWAYTAIMEMADQKIINGVGNSRFAPDLKVSAAMFLTLTGRIAFPNIAVTGSDWSGPYVTAAQNAGWLSGTAIRTDNVEADITRYDMAAVLAAVGKQLGLSSSGVEVYKIKDYAAIPNGYTKAVEQVYGQGLINGDGEGNFNGTATMSRAEAAMVLWRLKGLLATDKKQPSPVSVPASGQDIYEQCSPAVFRIDTYDADGNLYALGSGFFIDSSGLAVTNHHVLEDALSATATLENGQTYNISGVVEFDEELDYAVILVEGSGFPALKVGDSLAIKSGETVYAIGNPKGLSNTISDGIISNPRRENFDGMIQISVPISSGSSGGALLNTAGEVIGITTASLSSGQNLNFAVPMDQINSVDELLKTVRDPGIFTMEEYAEYNEYLVFDALPEDLADFDAYDEVEPNDTPKTATRVYNGEVIVGTITSNANMDYFTVHCNTAGAIEIILLSDSAPKYVNDAVLCVLKDGFPSVYADHEVTDSGEDYLYLRAVVKKPGVYTIQVRSAALYKTENLNTDYEFYYLFTPGDISGENTTGARQNTKSRREMAYDTLVSWLNNNANSSIQGYKEYLLTQTKTNGHDEYSVFYNTKFDVLELYCRSETDGARFTAFISFDRSDSTAFISYFFSNPYSNTEISATAEVSISNFSENCRFSFSTVEGDTSSISLHEEMCRYLCLSALDFTDYILHTYLSDYGYSIADFGFTNLDN